MSTNVVIIGSALSGNKGAAAMLEAAIEGLSARVPGIRFTLLSMYPEEDRQLNRYSNLEVVSASPFRLGVVINSLALLHRILPPLRPAIQRGSAAIGALSQADVMLDQGGITFSDGREKFLLYNVASILPALMLGVPVVKCAQAIGPFESRINRLVARIFLPKMALIVTRGRITHGFAQDLELKNIQPGADLAFTLDHSDLGGAANDAFVSGLRPDRNGTVGLAPSVVLEKKFDRTGGDYAAEMVQFIEYLAARKLQVLLLPHSARTKINATHNNDLPLCRKIYQALSHSAQEYTIFIDEEWSARALRNAISHCDVFVTSRFHAMVSGLATGTPTLVIGWSHKYQEVLEMFGADRWAFSHQELNQESLRSRFEEMWKQRDEIAAKLKGGLPGVRAKASLQLDHILTLLKD